MSRTRARIAVETFDRSVGASGRRFVLTVLLALALGACAAREAPKPAPPGPAPQPSPEAPALPVPQVLDSHGRILVEAMEYPWSAVGRLNTGGRGYCTGILIGARTVLASARCLYNAIEGRWWAPSELHFVAAYQRDRYLIHAPVDGAEVPAAFDPRVMDRLSNALANWSLVTLAEPIGRQAGWLGLRTLDAALEARLGRDAWTVRFGYRRDAPHAQTLKLACADGGPIRPGSAPCDPAETDARLPFLLLADGEVRVLADPLLFEALSRAESFRGRSRAPSEPGPAAPRPRDTLARLLLALGYLDSAPDAVAPESLRQAVRDFEARLGRPLTGEPSVGLLGPLVGALQRSWREEVPRVSQLPADLAPVYAALPDGTTF